MVLDAIHSRVDHGVLGYTDEPPDFAEAVADHLPARHAFSLCSAAGVSSGNDVGRNSRLGTVSFQHRFGSALNQHVHLHACVADGVDERCVAVSGVTFHAARPLTASDLMTFTQRVRLRLVRCFFPERFS
ncbi:MAG: hypothetical protein EBZ13_00595 [Planctomycetia bacterium]|nr:hypothetical protein [Planctomycetia bacterium]